MTVSSYVPPSSVELASDRSWIDLMSPAIQLAKAVANTDFVPKGMRGNPAAITAAILYGDEVGLGPMQSLARIAVIDGRPTLYAETQRGLIFAAGHELWVEDATATRVTVAGRRKDSDNVTRVTWSMDDAKRANLAGKHSWRTYPRQMLLARASAELARALFPDVIGGLSAIEELDEDAAPQAPSEDVPQTKTTRRRRKDRPALAPVEDVTPAAPAEAEAPAPQPETEGQPEGVEDAMSDTQRRRMFALFRERGIEDRADRLQFASAAIGRALESSADLTMHEASQVMDALEQLDTVDADPNAKEAPTKEQLEWLDARYLDTVASAAQLWAIVATWRGRDVDELLDEAGGRDSTGTPYWAPLRALLTREEVQNLGAMLTLKGNV